MAADNGERASSVRYEADESPPTALTLGLGLQLAMLCIAGIVLTPAIVIRAAGGSEDYLSWAMFAAIAVSGVSTILQTVRVGRIGAGYVLMMGTSAAFIAICVTAIAEGGPAMLATLVVISSIFQFTVSSRLFLLRRILTPAVAGTVIMLIAVTAMPIVFDMMTEVPEGSAPFSAEFSTLATIVVMVGIGLKAAGALRLWAPVIGIVAGTVVAVWFGLYDSRLVAEAAWVGLPSGSWPGFDLSFGPTFWALLPAFAFVTVVGAIETIGDAVAIQRVSWRRERAVDFRAVQGAVAADGVGNLLSGLAGTVPNTTYSTSVSVIELTGVAARRVGVAAGALFVAMAFIPKAPAVILAIPGPVAAAYITVLIAMLFVVGMRIVVQEGIDHRNGLIAGLSFWVGVGLQNGAIFPEFFSEFAGGLLQNGMTSGGLLAIVLTLFVELTEPRRRRIEVDFDIAALPAIRNFIADFASVGGWGTAMADRLDAVGEETLLTLLNQDTSGGTTLKRRLLVTAQKRAGEAILEFAAAPGTPNLEDRIALLGKQSGTISLEREVSLRLLRHLASSVRHQQYHDTDIVTVRVTPPDAASGGAGS